MNWSKSRDFIRTVL